MENFNSFEYSAEQKCEGKYSVYKLLLILAYITFAAAYLVFIILTKLIPLGALIPFFLWIFVFLTWKYLSPDYKYVIEAGTFSFYISYSSKKKSKEPKASLKLADAAYILPADDAGDTVREFAPAKVYSAVPSKASTDVYVILYTEKDGTKAAIYFVAVPDALRLLKRYITSANAE